METKKWLCPTLVIVGLLVAVAGIINNNWILIIAGAIILVAGLIVCAGKSEVAEDEAKPVISTEEPAVVSQPEALATEIEVEDAVESESIDLPSEEIEIEESVEPVAEVEEVEIVEETTDDESNEDTNQTTEA
jgi:hypothetical protein